MNGSWIKLYRKMLESPVWATWYYPQKLLAVEILLRVSPFQTRKNTGKKVVNIQPGQLLTSLSELCAYTGLTRQTVRTSLTRLQSLQFLDIETTQGQTLITLVNWEEYQGMDGTPNTDDNTDLTQTQHRPNTATPKKQHALSIYREYYKKEEKEKKKEIYSVDFLEFWNFTLWQGTRRGSKDRSLVLWRYWRRHGKIDEIWQATRNYHKSQPEREFIPSIPAYLAKKQVVRNHWTAWTEDVGAVNPLADWKPEGDT